MQLPKLNAKADTITYLSQFGGLNKGESIQEGEWSDMSNMTNDYFPVFAPRKLRGEIATLSAPQGVLGGKTFAYVNDNKLYYAKELVKELEETDNERILVMMGAYLCVFPDGYIYNTYDGTEKTINNTTTAEGVEIQLCKLDGTSYDSTNTVVSDSEPSDTSMYWLDTSQDTVVMKMYSSNTSAWVSVGTTYVKFTSTGIGTGFKAYDGVKFTGVDTGDWCYNGYDFNQTNLVYACDDDSLIVVGLINLNHTNSTAITFERELPQMDFVCEMDNRLWGCSSDNHEVYACKQGDPTNWNCFAGLDSDSYAATVGTQNVFTGCVSYGGYVFFFKEDGFHKLYGTKPSNYEMVWKPCRGVQGGSEKSIAIVDEYLIYKARDGIVMYDGSSDMISTKLGTEPYFEAVAGGFRDKYYISMRDNDYNYRLYVYDLRKGSWCIEDDIRLKYIATTDDGLYIIDYYGTEFVVNNEIIYTPIFLQDTRLSDTYHYPNDEFNCGYIPNGTMEDTFEWSFTTGDIGMDSPYHKYIKRIIPRIWLDTNAKLRIEVEYDSSDDWESILEIYATRKRTYEVPIPVRRCDHLKIRFSGFGGMKFYSLGKAREEGR